MSNNLGRIVLWVGNVIIASVFVLIHGMGLLWFMGTAFLYKD